VTSEQFWAALRKEGYTIFRVIDVGARRNVIMQTRTPGEFVSVDHPDDFSPDQREAIVGRFLNR
jgi:hypothetical protein